ncbi:MAG TPA: hypothetical protein VF959_07115, partial [Casimicrobiaceae bacterium]
MPKGNPPRSTSGANARRLIAAFAAFALVAQPLAPALEVISSARAQTLPDLGEDSRALYAPAQVPKRQPPAPAADPLPSERPLSLPDLGDESQALYSPAQERKLGESVVRQIRASGAYLDDPEVNDYLNDIGHRLLAARPD